MKLGIPKETAPGERRVAATPDTVRRLAKLGFTTLVESGAGARASFPDTLYEAQGATVVESASELMSQADVVLKIHPPREEEIDLFSEGQTLISLIYPAQHEELLEALAERKLTVLGLDCVPRISRAQALDVLSSMAGIAGYRAIIEAANAYGRTFGMQVTAAGSADPAKVLVIGAGVAGLAAVAQASSMGARVMAFDTRAAAREEVESLGGAFLELAFEESGEGEGGYGKVMSKAFIEAELALFLEKAPETDIIVTTAMIPGKRAPILITQEIVEAMRPGSVVVDLAAAGGGNCELTEPDTVVDHGGVQILGYTNLTARLPGHASEFFGRNLVNLLKLMGGADDYRVDRDDEVIRGMLVLDEGDLSWPPPTIESPPPPQQAPAQAAPVLHAAAQDSGSSSSSSSQASLLALVVTLVCLGLVSLVAPPAFLQHVTVFILACFVGWQVVWNVSHSLHTPLMSVTNAISGIIILGGLLQVTATASGLVLGLGALAIVVASINIFGGFLVTQRMLKMFRRGSTTGGEA